jgi:hypothetical protein
VQTVDKPEREHEGALRGVLAKEALSLNLATAPVDAHTKPAVQPRGKGGTGVAHRTAGAPRPGRPRVAGLKADLEQAREGTAARRCQTGTDCSPSVRPRFISRPFTHG